MKKVLLSLSLIATLCPTLSSAGLFDFSKAGDSLRASGRYMGVAAVQGAMLEGTMQTNKLVVEQTENPVAGAGILALGLSGSVWLGKFREGARPLNITSIPRDTFATTHATKSAADSDGLKSVISSTSINSPKKAIGDLAFNYAIKLLMIAQCTG